MYVFFISFVLILLGVSLLIRREISGRAGQPLAIAQMAARTRPVDLQAFRNLIDPAEDEFLRTRLPAAQFRRIHRRRLFAALHYINAASKNAGILVKAGEAARQSPDPQTAAAGEQMVE